MSLLSIIGLVLLSGIGFIFLFILMIVSVLSWLLHRAATTPPKRRGLDNHLK